MKTQKELVFLMSVLAQGSAPAALGEPNKIIDCNADFGGVTETQILETINYFGGAEKLWPVFDEVVKHGGK